MEHYGLPSHHVNMATLDLYVAFPLFRTSFMGLTLDISIRYHSGLRHRGCLAMVGDVRMKPTSAVLPIQRKSCWKNPPDRFFALRRNPILTFLPFSTTSCSPWALIGKFCMSMRIVCCTRIVARICFSSTKKTTPPTYFPSGKSWTDRKCTHAAVWAHRKHIVAVGSLRTHHPFPLQPLRAMRGTSAPGRQGNHLCI